MEAEEKWFYVWLSILTVLLGTAPFAYWQGYHLSGIFFAIAGLGGLLMFIRDRLAATASKWPIRVSLKVLAVVALSLLVAQLIAREITGYRVNQEISSVQWWLYGLTLLLVAVVVSAVLSKTKPSKLVIHWANYRAVENGGEEFQVGDFLQHIISGDSLVFDIENHNFKVGGKDFVPHDPLPFKEKRLQVNYSYGNEPARTTERREHGRLLLPEDSKIKWLTGEVDRIKEMYLEEYKQRTKLQDECTQAGNKVRQIEKALSARPELSLTSLQIEAIRLSLELLGFLKRLGTPPAPKYTAKEIDDMTSVRMRELIDANDGDFFEACEYHRSGRLAFSPAQLETQLTTHWTRLLPWYQKVAASYALEFKGKVETLYHRFTLEGMSDEVLLLPVQGGNGVKDVRAISAKLWELAFKVGERGSA